MDETDLRFGPLLSDWGLLSLLDLPNQVETFDGWKTIHGELRRLTAIWSGLPNSTDPAADEAELVREINQHLGDGVRIGLCLHPTLGTTLELQPKNLATAIWLRFAEAIAFKRHFQPCKRCNRWMHILHDSSGRSTRRYCSDTCRLGSYRTRQADAVELAKTGAPIEDIAEKIGSNPDTVRRWIEVGGPNAARRAREQRQRPR